MAYARNPLVTAARLNARPLGPDALRFGDTPDRRLELRRLLAYQYGAYDTIESAARYDGEQRRFAAVERELARGGGSGGEFDAGGLGRRAKRAIARHVTRPRPMINPRAPQGLAGLGIAPIVAASAVHTGATALIHSSADPQRQAQARNAKEAALAGNVTAFEYLKGRAAGMPDPKHGFAPALAELVAAGASDGSRLTLSPQWREPGAKALFDYAGSPGFSTTPPAGAVISTGGGGGGAPPPPASGLPPGWQAAYGPAPAPMVLPTYQPVPTYGPAPAPAPAPGPGAGAGAPHKPGWLTQFLSQIAQGGAGAAQAYVPPSGPAPAPIVVQAAPGAPGGAAPAFDTGSLIVPALIVGGLLILTRR